MWPHFYHVSADLKCEVEGAAKEIRKGAYLRLFLTIDRSYVRVAYAVSSTS